MNSPTDAPAGITRILVILGFLGTLCFLPGVTAHGAFWSFDTHYVPRLQSLQLSESGLRGEGLWSPRAYDGTRTPHSFTFRLPSPGTCVTGTITAIKQLPGERVPSGAIAPGISMEEGGLAVVRHGRKRVYPIPVPNVREVIRWIEYSWHGDHIRWAKEEGAPEPELQRLRDTTARKFIAQQQRDGIAPLAIRSILKAGNVVVFRLDGHVPETVGRLGGVLLFDLSTREWRVKRHPWLLDTSITNIVQAGGKLWLGTITFTEGGPVGGEGILIYDHRASTWARLSARDGTLTGTRIDILKRKGDEIQIATERGVDRFDIRTHRAQHFYWTFRGKPDNPELLLCASREQALQIRKEFLLKRKDAK